MNINIRQTGTNETIADYFAVHDKTAFRFALLKKIIEAHAGGVIFMIDTNQRIHEQAEDEVLAGLENAGIAPIVMRIPANPQQFLGFHLNMRRGRVQEKLIFFELTGPAFTRELFDSLCGCDIAIGIGAKQGLPAIYEDLRLDGILFNDEYFDISLYDSILCAGFRFAFDARSYIKETINEMDL